MALESVIILGVSSMVQMCIFEKTKAQFGKRCESVDLCSVSMCKYPHGNSIEIKGVSSRPVSRWLPRTLQLGLISNESKEVRW